MVLRRAEMANVRVTIGARKAVCLVRAMAERRSSMLGDMAGVEILCVAGAVDARLRSASFTCARLG